MARYGAKEIETKKIWEEFLLSKSPKSFLQSWNWGETNSLLGKRILRLGYYKGSTLVGASLLIKEEAKRGQHFLIPGGPLIDWNNKRLVRLFVDTIKELAREENVWFVRVRPEILDNPKSQKLFENLGFIPAPMHLHAENTWILDISKTDEEIFLGMRKTTRYLVKKSLKENLKISFSVNPKDTKTLEDLQKETVARHEFVGFSEELFKAQLKTFGKDGQAALVTCSKGDENLVSAIIIFYGDTAYYHHSGSSEKSRSTNASYFLQWEVIKEAKKRGCKYYNFWGVAPADDPNHRFAGVTIFKKGFGGGQVDWLHAHDLPILPLYWATYLFESLRRITRRL